MMPEKIWAHLRQLSEEATPENTTWNTFGRGTEYIRADIHAAEVARLNKALEEARERARLVHQTEATPLEMYQSQYEMRQTLVVFPERAPELAAWLKENR